MARSKNHEKIIPELGVSIVEYNRELDEANAEIDRGEYFTNEEVLEMTGKLLDGTFSQKDLDAYAESILQTRRADFTQQNANSR